MARVLQKDKVVVFTGAGVSAESGIRTFRDSNGLWNEYLVEDVATPAAWQRNPELVLDFYNDCRQQMSSAKPNAAHDAIARLEETHEVVVVTQNIDDLHERAGSSQVIHLHGEISKARSSLDETLIYDIGSQPLKKGDFCELRSQLRPHIVWFGENIINYDEARNHVRNAARILVIGTSLNVYPAAGLLKKASFHAEKAIVSLEVDSVPFGYKFIRGKATNIVPRIVGDWMNGGRAF
ncbi:NAD-dependent deacylase [Litoribacillus peritrichatus]|uniref:NAD-dependent protein deacylase n=1 Tax=Litoribacillus peritrichatus TaxID=718191 RepID=A0ABP7MFJ8_9GAMM